MRWQQTTHSTWHYAIPGMTYQVIYVLLLFHLPSDNVYRLYQSCHPPTKIVTRRIKWLKPWIILSIIREYWQNLTNNAVPLVKDCTGSWPTLHPSKMKGWHHALPIKSNQATNSTELCSPSCKGRYTQYTKMIHIDRPTVPLGQF